MAADTIVTGSKLTTIAGAIRAKTGGSSQLTLDQMATEIASIPAGSVTLTKLGQAVLTCQYPQSAQKLEIAASDFGISDGTNVYIRDSAFAGGTTCKSLLKSIEIPSWIEKIGRYAFQGNEYLEDISFQGDTSNVRLKPEQYAFAALSSAQTRFVCNRRLIPSQYMIQGSGLTYIEFTVASPYDSSSSSGYVPNFCFQSMSALQTVVFHHRQQYNGVANGGYMQVADSAFSTSTKNVTKLVLDTDALVPVEANPTYFPFRSFTAATIYVTDSLLSTYQSNANWTACLAQYTGLTLDSISNYVA